MTKRGAGKQQILLQYLLPPLLIQHQIVQLAHIAPRHFRMLHQLPWCTLWAVMGVFCTGFYVYFATLWLMQDGEPLRQRADYEYSAEGDLISAHDEHRRTWHYAYQHHLITRYTDRTGRGMNLEWLGEGSDAKAVHE